MSKLEECILGDLVEFQRGYDLPKSKFVEGKYPVQSSNGILGYHNEYKVEGPGITIGRSGTVGNPHLIRENFFPHNTSLFVKEFKGNDIEYIYYLLQYLDLGNQKSGSGVPTMNRNHLHPIKIRAYRDKTYQQRTIKILSLIDKKIQINNQINHELEAMAKTLYDYWFVQFDFPDQNGKPYKSSGGKMVYNPELKREIPEGWGNSTLGEFADLYQPKTISDKEMIEDGEYLVYGANGNIGRYSEYNHEDSMVTISCRGNCGIINVTRPYSWITGNSMVVKPKDDIYNIDYISNLLLSLSISSVITGSVQKQLTRTSLVPLKIIIPNKEIIEKYRAITNVSFEKRKAIQIEVEQLTQLRDWLLPMLMNGQVKVE